MHLLITIWLLLVLHKQTKCDQVTIKNLLIDFILLQKLYFSSAEVYLCILLRSNILWYAPL